MILTFLTSVASLVLSLASFNHNYAQDTLLNSIHVVLAQPADEDLFAQQEALDALQPEQETASATDSMALAQAQAPQAQPAKPAKPAGRKQESHTIR